MGELHSRLEPSITPCLIMSTRAEDKAATESICCSHDAIGTAPYSSTTLRTAKWGMLHFRESTNTLCWPAFPLESFVIMENIAKRWLWHPPRRTSSQSARCSDLAAKANSSLVDFVACLYSHMISSYCATLQEGALDGKEQLICGKPSCAEKVIVYQSVAAGNHAGLTYLQMPSLEC